ncbi:MAG: DUF3021 domain-containing protein [Clostridia bacterium]|nr:DUF3021 domain-containing protein [Clostridia bacterium]
MSEFWKKTAKTAGIGFALGVLVGMAFLLPCGIGAYRAAHGAGRLALYLAMSGLLGAVNMGSTTIYSLEHWGLLRCTLTHFLIAMACMCLIGFAMGWFDPREPITLWMLALCVVVYFIIWLIMYRLYKRQIRRINAALKAWKRAREE